MEKICILGGDKRQIELHRLLERDYSTKLFGFDMQKDNEHEIIECLEVCDALMLPIPLKIENSIMDAGNKDLKISIFDVLSVIKKDCFIFYGGLTDVSCQYFNDYSYSYNLLQDEDFLIENAILTAEAAIAISMQDLGISYKDLTVCVIGYGRIGKELVRFLNAFNAKVIVCSTKNIVLDKGEEVVKTSNAIYAINKSDLVFNTAPYKIVENDEIKQINKNVKIRELSSRPYGFDIDFFECAGYNIKVLPSLPGKVLFKSAARIIRNKIITTMEKDNGFKR